MIWAGNLVSSVGVIMSFTTAIALPIDQIKEFCQRHPIQKLSLFGSVLRADFHADSAVDMLVEFTSGARIGYFELIGMEIELTEIVGRKVDLRTPGELSQYFRQKVQLRLFMFLDDAVRLRHRYDAAQTAIRIAKGKTRDALALDCGTGKTRCG
jgi:uncharacterized protein